MFSQWVFSVTMWLDRWIPSHTLFCCFLYLLSRGILEDITDRPTGSCGLENQVHLSKRRTRAVQSEPRIASTFVKKLDAGRVEVTYLGHRLGVSSQPQPQTFLHKACRHDFLWMLAKLVFGFHKASGREGGVLSPHALPPDSETFTSSDLCSS